LSTVSEILKRKYKLKHEQFKPLLLLLAMKVKNQILRLLTDLGGSLLGEEEMFRCTSLYGCLQVEIE